MSMLKQKTIYDTCADLRKKKPDYKVDEETVKEITSNFRTLPTFEQSLFDRVFIKHYSLQRNERLKCRWLAYVRNIESRVFAPFKFPSIRDIHFHNGVIQYLRDEKRYQFDNRFKLKPGPGVDYGGQMPIPQDLLMKRSGYAKEGDKGNKKKTKSAVNQTK